MQFADVSWQPMANVLHTFDICGPIGRGWNTIGCLGCSVPPTTFDSSAPDSTAMVSFDSDNFFRLIFFITAGELQLQDQPAALGFADLHAWCGRRPMGCLMGDRG